MVSRSITATLCLVALTMSHAQADQVFTNNVVVRPSLAVGMDAQNQEDFGFDTIRLKENNVRIRFDDTSNSASFPNNDWQLTANDSTNGGGNFFSIDDITAGRQIFTVEAGAPEASLFVTSSGFVGLSTESPTKNLHIAAGDSPTIRFDQNTSDGLAGQTWDLIGNESGILFRDETSGGSVPLKVKPGSPDNTLVLGAKGVGIGIGTAANKLHVRETSDSTTALIENTNTTADARTVLQLNNNGPAGLGISNTTSTATPSDWSFTVDDTGSLVIGSGGNPLLTIDATGNLTATGTVNGSSDRDRKEGFTAVDSSEILESLSKIPVQKWRYKGEEVTHIGPIAQEFHQAFSVGSSDRTIAMADADGVALAAIQALHADAKEKESTIEELRKENQKLEERLEALERFLVAP